MHIAPGIHKDEWINLYLDEPSSEDWNRAIEIFSARITSRYIEPVDIMIKEDESRSLKKRRYGFSIIAMDCLLIETLQSFRDGLKDTKKNSKEMLKKYLTEREGFKDYFNNDQAEKFYYDFCRIFQAEIMGPSLLWPVESLKGEKAGGTPYVNMTKFHEIVKDNFERYCNELRNSDNAKLRENFRGKMDFIARKVGHPGICEQKQGDS